MKLLFFFVAFCTAFPFQAFAASELLAVNVVLEPGSALAKQAKAKNQELREIYPAGYAFDKTHFPHVTLVQRFVRRADLAKLAKAIHSLTPKRLPPLKLTGLEPSEWENGLSLLSYNVEATPELKKLADDITAATQPFAVKSGTEDAFVKDPEESFGEKTVSYVESFVPAASGPNFKPHLTVGLAPIDQANELKAKPEELQSFPAPEIRIYQLGKFGTARKRLR